MSVDARILRLEQGIVTVVLLAGFVFGVAWAIPIAAVMVGLDLALGPSGPIPRFVAAAVAPRLRPPRTLEDARGVHLHQILVGGVLVVATLLWLADVGGLAMLLAVLVAMVSALCATGLACAGCELRRRINRGR